MFLTQRFINYHILPAIARLFYNGFHMFPYFLLLCGIHNTKKFSNLSKKIFRQRNTSDINHRSCHKHAVVLCKFHKQISALHMNLHTVSHQSEFMCCRCRRTGSRAFLCSTRYCSSALLMSPVKIPENS